MKIIDREGKSAITTYELGEIVWLKTDSEDQWIITAIHIDVDLGITYRISSGITSAYVYGTELTRDKIVWG